MTEYKDLGQFTWRTKITFPPVNLVYSVFFLDGDILMENV